MRLRIVPLRERGVARDRAQLRSEVGVVGDLYVEEFTSEEMCRTVRIARVAAERPKDSVPLPTLIDVQLLWLGNHGFVLAGFERLSGVDYAQSWWCRTC